MEVVLKITEFRVNANYSKSGLTAATIGDVLYAIDIPNSCQIDSETGEKTFSIEGIRHIIKGLHLSLTIDADREDF